MDSSIHVCAQILVQPILIDNKDRVLEGRKANSLDVALARKADGGACICTGMWRRGVQGFRGIYWGWFCQGWLVRERHHCSIVLCDFFRGGLCTYELHWVYLMGIGEEHSGSRKLSERCVYIFVHLHNFFNDCRKFCTVV